MLDTVLDTLPPDIDRWCRCGRGHFRVLPATDKLLHQLEIRRIRHFFHYPGEYFLLRRALSFEGVVAEDPNEDRVDYIANIRVVGSVSLFSLCDERE
jgi:hypothetical protein